MRLQNEMQVGSDEDERRLKDQLVLLVLRLMFSFVNKIAEASYISFWSRLSPQADLELTVTRLYV